MHRIAPSPVRRTLQPVVAARLIDRELRGKRRGQGHHTAARGDSLSPIDGGSREKALRIGNAAVRVGTSGWHYKHWIGDFYPPRLPRAQMLAWYAREFHTVEINNSFYRLPEEKTFEQWRRIVPPGFIFAVKASRFLTHIKRLKDPEDSIKLFLSRATYLGDHLGPVLFQFPPKWKADHARLKEFLSLLPRKHKYVIEFRDESWYTREIFDLLQQHNVALCLHDWREAPFRHGLTAKFTYIRFHGTTGKYAGNYPDHVLQGWVQRIASWRELSEVYLYFNNDVGGYAVRNAQTLRGMVEKLTSESRLPQTKEDAA